MTIRNASPVLQHITVVTALLLTTSIVSTANADIVTIEAMAPVVSNTGSDLYADHDADHQVIDFSFNTANAELIEDGVSGNSSYAIYRINDVLAETVVNNSSGAQIAAGHSDTFIFNVTNGNGGTNLSASINALDPTEGSPHLTGEIQQMSLGISAVNTGFNQVVNINNFFEFAAQGGFAQNDAFSLFGHTNLSNGLYGELSDASSTFVVTTNAVPEPSSTLLVIVLGLFGLVSRSRRVG